MSKSLIYTLFILFACSVSCDILSSNNHSNIDIQTDKKKYDLRKDDLIKVTITNKSDRIIHYSTCLSKSLEVVKKNQSEKTLGLPVCYCLCPAELKPGESMPIHISSVSAEAFRVDDQTSIEPLTYRIKYSLYYDEAFGDDPIPTEYSRSNKFTITTTE